MEKVIYCRHCNEKHIVSETRDTEGNVVGLFCNRKPAMIVTVSTKWNGEDVYERLEQFLSKQVDSIALARIKPDKLNGLARKMAYLYIQTPYAKERQISYYWIHAMALDILHRLKQRLFYKTRGV